MSPTNHNPPLEDISTNGLSAVLVRDGRAPMTGNLNMGTTNKITNLANGSSAQDAVAFNQLAALTGANQGFLFGLTLSNNATDAVNDIDISSGSAADSTAAPYNIMTLASTLTKRLDAAWSVGSGQGGLDTGSIANSTYHVWLIQRSDTGVVDALFSTSAIAPTMPANYDRKRRIGSIVRQSASIVSFTQNGDSFTRNTPFSELASATGTNTAQTLTLAGVPSGIIITANLGCALFNASVTGAGILISSLFETDRAPGSIAGDNDAIIHVINIPEPFLRSVITNNSAQIRYRNSATSNQFSVVSKGWVDTRGR